MYVCPNYVYICLRQQHSYLSRVLPTAYIYESVQHQDKTK